MRESKRAWTCSQPRFISHMPSTKWNRLTLNIFRYLLLQHSLPYPEGSSNHPHEMYTSIIAANIWLRIMSATNKTNTFNSLQGIFSWFPLCRATGNEKKNFDQENVSSFFFGCGQKEILLFFYVFFQLKKFPSLSKRRRNANFTSFVASLGTKNLSFFMCACWQQIFIFQLLIQILSK